MLPLPFFTPPLLLILFSTSSHQVDITLSNAGMTAICPNIPPGICCTLSNLSNLGVNLISSVQFSHLHFLDIAAIWAVRPRRDKDPLIGQCSGAVKISRNGPGTWEYDEWLAGMSGASYIRLPQALPPEKDCVGALDAEGIMGLVWGGGKWFSSPAAERLLSFGGTRRMVRKRRDVRSPYQGTVYAGGPRRVVYPGLLMVNRSNYTSVAVEGLMYRDDLTGRTVDVGGLVGSDD